MYRIVHTLYCTAVPEHCVVVSLKTSRHQDDIPRVERYLEERQVRSQLRTNSKRKRRSVPSSRPSAGLCPVTFPFHSGLVSQSFAGLLSLSLSTRPALPYPNFLALDIHPNPSYPLSSQPILTLVSPAHSLDQSFDQRRALSRFPIDPAFPNRPDVCPSFNLPQVAFISISGVYPFYRPPLPPSLIPLDTASRHESESYCSPSPDG